MLAATDPGAERHGPDCGQAKPAAAHGHRRGESGGPHPATGLELDRDEVDLDIGGFRQGPQVTRIGGENIVAVGGQAHHGGVNRIPSPPLVTGTRPASRSRFTSATTPRSAPSTARNAPASRTSIRPYPVPGRCPGAGTAARRAPRPPGRARCGPPPASPPRRSHHARPRSPPGTHPVPAAAGQPRSGFRAGRSRGPGGRPGGGAVGCGGGHARPALVEPEWRVGVGHEGGVGDDPQHPSGSCP
jgi:hypothetical protein